ncbi:MAG TPA: hypothetical protein EYP57_01590 [Thermodesulfobacteriaceae bacterium]|nr:hypothetical protein [Thermodesulfobacteriaceae bacterium]
MSDFDSLTGRLNFSYHGRKTVQYWSTGLYTVPVVEKGGFAVVDLSLSKRIFSSPHFGSFTLRGEIRIMLDTELFVCKESSHARPDLFRVRAL